jgi:hypothetical protein
MVTADRARRRAPWLGLVVGLIVVGLLLGVSATMHALGISDPTEDTFAVTLRNDTAAPVLLKQCDVKCYEFGEQDRLAPGGTVRVNTTAAGSANWWVVEDGGGRLLGCNLQYNHKQVGVVVNVSGTVACPA